MAKRSLKTEPASPSPKGYYTTNQAAKICGISHRTIAKLFDAGVIKGYRLPGSGFRRIPEQELLSFIASCGMPASSIPSSAKGPWVHCWEYRRLRGQEAALCEDCEVRLSHTRYCWRFAGSELRVCRYQDGECHKCRYFVWASPMAEESRSSAER